MKYVAIIETAMMNTDSNGRTALVRSFLRSIVDIAGWAERSQNYFEWGDLPDRRIAQAAAEEFLRSIKNLPEGEQKDIINKLLQNENPEPDNNGEDWYEVRITRLEMILPGYGLFCQNMEEAIDSFFLHTYDIFKNFNIDIETEVAFLAEEEGLSREKYLVALRYFDAFYDDDESNYYRGMKPRSARFKYKTLPRTHAIAAVNGLLEKLGVHRSIDKVRIAEFVEAVTGGNIEAAGKDAVSYKQPTKDAQAAAAELLKKINL